MNHSRLKVIKNAVISLWQKRSCQDGRYFKKKDKRVYLFENKSNIGLTKSLNILIDHSNGNFIARQDADDYSLPMRFEKQIKYLKKEFQIISLDYLYECLKNNYKLSPKDVVVTFDDGYKSYIKNVTPLLMKKKIPSLVFLNSEVSINDKFKADSKK